ADCSRTTPHEWHLDTRSQAPTYSQGVDLCKQETTIGIWTGTLTPPFCPHTLKSTQSTTIAPHTQAIKAGWCCTQVNTNGKPSVKSAVSANGIPLSIKRRSPFRFPLCFFAFHP